MRVGYYLSWFFWSGITHAMLDADQSPSQRALFGMPLYLIRRGCVSAVRAIGAAIVGNMTIAVERAIDVAFAAGYAMRVWQPRRSRQTTMISNASSSRRRRFGEPRPGSEVIEASGGGPQ